MSVSYTFFVAANNDVAALVADSPTGPVAADFPVVEGVEPAVQMATLLELLTGTDYDEIVDDTDWADLVSDPAAEGGFVMTMPDSFRDALADATPERLAEVAVPWSETEEFWGDARPEDLVPMLLELRDLAAAAREGAASIYCFAAL